MLSLCFSMTYVFHLSYNCISINGSGKAFYKDVFGSGRAFSEGNLEQRSARQTVNGLAELAAVNNRHLSGIWDGDCPC
jgi:hypothetical protein